MQVKFLRIKLRFHPRLHARRILLRENSFCAEDDSKISALCVLKITIQQVQSHDKIGVKFYAERANAKSANFLQNLRRNFTAKSSFKARQKSAKRLKSRRRKILTIKLRPQISPGKIALDGAGFELAANFPS